MLTLAGLILLLAGQTWFAGAHTVGVICLVAGLVVEVLPCLLVIWLGLVKFMDP